jgi:glycosyltransferase involved in cell wall biosynthesis
MITSTLNRSDTRECIVRSSMLVCLLPARNCADDLLGYFESVARFADAVVALDDGSTDHTGEVLACNPLVRVLLQNRRRAGYRGWDDSANRNRLLAAAADLDPDWIMSLDADERIDPTDGAALREFVTNDAVRGDAYLFRVFRMIEDLGHYDQSHLWVGRLFAHERGQVFPADRLHFVPLPTSIPEDRWRRTTFRIQHLSGLTESRRHARFEKYREVDGARQFQPDYSHLLQPPARIRAWWPRSSQLPVFANTRNATPERSHRADGTHGTDGVPTLSVIVIEGDRGRLDRTVSSVVNQRCPEPFEVIVVTRTNAPRVSERFPGVKVVELSQSAPLRSAHSAGLVVSRGEFVTVLPPDVEVLPGSLAACILAHRLGYAMVGGTALNATRTLAGWASYFLDNSEALPEAPSQELHVPPSWSSHLRAALLELDGLPDAVHAGDTAAVNVELFERGYGAYRARDVLFVRPSSCRAVGALLRHHFRKGRVAGIRLLDNGRVGVRSPATRILRSVALSAARRMRQITSDVHRWGGSTRPYYLFSSPLVAAAVLSEWLGACTAIARAAGHSR